MARQLGKATRAWKGFPVLYILICFFGIPLLLLGLSSMFTTKKTAQVAVASIIVVLLFAGLVAFSFWWARRGGKEKVGAYFARRQLRVHALETLPYDMAWCQRRIKEMQNSTGISAASVGAVTSESKDVYANVATEIKHVMTTVKRLIDHLGLEKESDPEGLGRFYNKEKEPMPDVDMSGKKMWTITIVCLGAVCLALYSWGVAALFITGSVATVAMAGWLLGMLGLCIIWRIYIRCSGGGLNDSAYIDKQHKKVCKQTYTQDMAQMTADVDKMALETHLPALAEDQEGTKEHELDDSDPPANDEMSA